MPYDIAVPECAAEDAARIWSGEYEVPLTVPPKTVLDLGANVGLFSAWAAQRWPGCRIDAYEPWRENVLAFARNLKAYPKAILYPVGVRGEAGIYEMSEDLNPMCHTFMGGTGPKRRTRCVAVDTLPSYEFVKLDIEGCEWEVIQKLDLSATQAIAMEAHNGKDAASITTFLTQRGFALHHRRHDPNGCTLLKFIRRTAVSLAPKLFVAIPTYGAAPAAFWQCLMKLQASPPCKLAIDTHNGDSLVSRARNAMTGAFLASDCTHLLFIDSDLIFSPEHVGRLMEHDVDVVAGFYPKKQEGKLQWVCNAAVNETKPDANGLQEVRYMGTGFMRVSRVALERMCQAHPESAYNPDGDSTGRVEFDLWPVGVYRYPDGSKRYLSEDWYFCQRWLDLGGKVYGDTRVILKHVGTAVYPLRSQVGEILKP